MAMRREILADYIFLVQVLEYFEPCSPKFMLFRGKHQIIGTKSPTVQATPILFGKSHQLGTENFVCKLYEQWDCMFLVSIMLVSRSIAACMTFAIIMKGGSGSGLC